MADGRMLKAVGMGDLEIILPNGQNQTKTTFKDSVYTPEMAFTLISISKLDKAKYKVVFHNHLCTIVDPNGKTKYHNLKVFTGSRVPKTEPIQQQHLKV